MEFIVFSTYKIFVFVEFQNRILNNSYLANHY